MNRLKRLAFAKKHATRSHGQWKHVIWTDESSFHLFGAKKRTFVWRKPNERYLHTCVVPTHKHGGGSLMIWGMMSGFGVGPLYRVSGTMNSQQYLEVMEKVMMPAAVSQFGQNFVYQQDNAPCHVSNKMKEWFVRNNINKLDWPAQSPDLSPIENLWKDVGAELQKHSFSNLDELWEAIKKVWQSIPPARCEALVMSVPRRLKACKEVFGGPTKY